MVGLMSTLTHSQEAALRYDTKTPRYLHIASNKTNRWGHQRSYRLQVFSFTGDHLPESQAEERAMSWARWDLTSKVLTILSRARQEMFYGCALD